MSNPTCPACSLDDVLSHPDTWECAICGHEWAKDAAPETARIVKDADNLDVDFELKEMQDRGSLIARKMEPSRKIIRSKKLYTKTAKKIWDELQKSDPVSWHIRANKWYKVKNAGK